ncbi:DNA-binding protein [Synergistales bacterium]|nr:DNA-binding protein [Synergistales bacterium]
MMKSTPVVGMQPELLKWARESIGKSPSDVAYALRRPVEEVESWERGDKAPTYVQLEKLAYEIYKRPIAVFFLPIPPLESNPQSDFRTLPEDDLRELLPDTYLHIRRARAYQFALRELLEGVSPNPIPMWHSVTLSEDLSVVQQAVQVRDCLGITLDEQTRCTDDEQALKQWRSSVERMGIFVFKNTFEQKSISGFCLSDDQFPVIYLNNSTTKTRQIFSLFHELTHLLLRMNGISKVEDTYIIGLPQREQKVERFCNALAAEILIPISDFRQQTHQISGNIENATETVFENLAARYSVSREAILRRFLDQKEVGTGFYERKAKEWASQQKQKTKGGNHYTTLNTYLSNKFSKEVFSRYHRQQITKYEASDYLGIKPKQFDYLERIKLRGIEA